MNKQKEKPKGPSNGPKKRKKYCRLALRTETLFQRGLSECYKMSGSCADNRS